MKSSTIPDTQKQAQIIERPQDHNYIVSDAMPHPKLFQPGNIHTDERAIMDLNLVGIVTRHKTDTESSVQVQFHDRSVNQELLFMTALNPTVAALSHEALVLACASEENTPSKIECMQFESSDSCKEWCLNLPKDENILGVTLGGGWLAAATDQQMVRLFSISGLQREVLRVSGTVMTMAAHLSQLIIVYQKRLGMPGDDCLGMMLLTVTGNKRAIVKDDQLPLTYKATLEWIGFSTEGTPFYKESTGKVFMMNRKMGNTWTQVADLRSQCSNADDYHMVGIEENSPSLRCVFCKGGQFPPTQPHLPIDIVNFTLPLCEMDTEKGILEEKFWRASLLSNYIDFSSDEGSEQEDVRSSAIKNEALLKMFILACKMGSERYAVEICELMPNEPMVQLAVKYAIGNGQQKLADQLADLAARKSMSEGNNGGATSEYIEEKCNENETLPESAERSASFGSEDGEVKNILETAEMTTINVSDRQDFVPMFGDTIEDATDQHVIYTDINGVTDVSKGHLNLNLNNPGTEVFTAETIQDIPSEHLQSNTYIVYMDDTAVVEISQDAFSDSESHDGWTDVSNVGQNINTPDVSLSAFQNESSVNAGQIVIGDSVQQSESSVFVEYSVPSTSHITHNSVELHPDNSVTRISTSGSVDIGAIINTVVSNVCTVCSKSFKSTHQLSRHMQTHTGVKPHTCTECSKSFGHAAALKNHMRVHFGVKHTCNICCKAFTYSSNLTRHMQIHMAQRSYKCNMCSKLFKTPALLHQHRKMHTGTRPYTCVICDKSFALSCVLSMHMKAHRGEKPHKCTVCPAAFLKVSHLKDHMRVHTKEKPFKCTVCAAQFTRAHSLKQHMLTHTGEKPHTCTVCAKAFTVLSQLTQHMQTHTGDKPHKCTVCDKAFAQKYLLTKHMRLHTGEKPYICSVCSESFVGLTELKRHQQIHTEKGGFDVKCRICSKPFSTPDGLQRHMKLHNANKEKYRCPVCSLTLSCQSTLKTHMLRHSGEKPYRCSICSASFGSLFNRKRHMWKHKDKKPHKCPVCSKSFIQADGLSKHMWKHTGERPHKCSVCSKSFPNPAYLKSHMKSHAKQREKFPCTVCSKLLGSQTAIRKHMQNHNPVCDECSISFASSAALKQHMLMHGSNRHMCNVCSKSFSSSATLRQHMLVHTGDKPHTCATCSRSFRSPYNLTRHMATHTGERPHKCKVCEKSYVRAIELAEHMQKHVGDTPHTCTDCSAAFTCASDLARHARIHNGNKHECTICSKSFMHASSLKLHMQTHTGQKSHICTSCSASFTTSYNLSRHMLTHTGTKSYQCTVCGHMFLRPDDLRRHMRTHRSTTHYGCTECSETFSCSSDLISHLNTHADVKLET